MQKRNAYQNKQLVASQIF